MPIFSNCRPTTRALSANSLRAIRLSSSVRPSVSRRIAMPHRTSLRRHSYEPFGTAADYRGDGPVRAWLYRIARNLAINAVTRAREFPSNEAHDLPVDRSPEWHLLRAADIAEVRKAIAALPEALRIPLIEREYHDRPYEEIADQLDLPLNTVRTRIHRARKALEAALEGTR